MELRIEIGENDSINDAVAKLVKGYLDRYVKKEISAQIKGMLDDVMAKNLTIERVQREVTYQATKWVNELLPRKCGGLFGDSGLHTDPKALEAVQLAYEKAAQKYVDEAARYVSPENFAERAAQMALEKVSDEAAAKLRELLIVTSTMKEGKQ